MTIFGVEIIIRTWVFNLMLYPTSLLAAFFGELGLFCVQEGGEQILMSKILIVEYCVFVPNFCFLLSNKT